MILCTGFATGLHLLLGVDFRGFSRLGCGGVGRHFRCGFLFAVRYLRDGLAVLRREALEFSHLGFEGGAFLYCVATRHYAAPVLSAMCGPNYVQIPGQFTLRRFRRRVGLFDVRALLPGVRRGFEVVGARRVQCDLRLRFHVVRHGSA